VNVQKYTRALHNTDVNGNWWEIDTVQDLYRARKAFSGFLSGKNPKTVYAEALI